MQFVKQATQSKNAVPALGTWKNPGGHDVKHVPTKVLIGVDLHASAVVGAQSRHVTKSGRQ